MIPKTVLRIDNFLSTIDYDLLEQQTEQVAALSDEHPELEGV